jgi:predicted Zn-ribbon and HTH transcriptional regulator
MSKSRWQEYKEKNGVTPLDLLNPQTRRTTDEVADIRMSTCNSCSELIKITSQCKKCGCFMSAKTKLESAKCPIGKW